MAKGHWVRRVLVIGALAGAVFVLDRQLAGRVHPNGAAFGLAFIVLVLFAAVLFPQQVQQFLERLTSVNSGIVQLGLEAVERSAVVEKVPHQEEPAYKRDQGYGTAPPPKRRRTGSIEGDLKVVRLLGGAVALARARV